MLSLERMKGRSGRGIGGGMDEMDGALSGGWIGAAFTVAGLVTVLVPNRYFSFCNKSLLLPGFQGEPPASMIWKNSPILWIDLYFQSVTGVH
ncbi:MULTISPECIES: hypothetical protein [unclassified Pseudomonas]|uniref:hypothetical protein n=1 Tax=unclassified Pseudomonas TaxID=196821 RepID=UPI0015A4EAF1|nr:MULTISPECIES: hypothetical protein [unclassified Pseudomonas]NWC91392.1 hypothetical protein [Pseudomonas sp. IPO3779]NWD17767.1 hypothetical protein [Pseudomonas sp. IPO3778]